MVNGVEDPKPRTVGRVRSTEDILVFKGKKTVAEYTGEFLRLQARCNLKESEEQVAARYLSGLNQSIQEELSLLSIWTIDQAQTLAMKVERSMSKRVMKFEDTLEDNSYSTKVIQSNQTQLTVGTNESSSLISPVLASGSGAKKQVAKMTDSNPYDKAIPPKCFRCGLPGHRSNTCPNRKTCAYVEEIGEDEFAYIDEFAHVEGEVVNLMVQQRLKIFRKGTRFLKLSV